jgi:hypothetical protein
MNKIMLSALVAASFAGPAFAGSVAVSTNRASFEAAYTTPFTVEDFTSTSHFPISSGVLNSATNQPGIGIAAGAIKAGVTYSTPIGGGNFFNIDAGGGFVGGFLDALYNHGLLTVAFDTPQAAFGFDTNALSPDLQVVVNFTDSTSQTFSSALTGYNLQFFGFSSTQSDIASVVIGSATDPAFSFALDNFTFGSGVSAVPESGSLALMLAGLALVTTVAKRRASRG